MMSPLTSRLLGRHSSNCSVASSASSGTSSDNTAQSKRPKSLSGYSADMEGSTSSQPPNQINLLRRHKRHATDADCHAKRRKTDEEQFDAFQARADISRAGLSCPTISTGKFSRVIRVGTVDMSNVKLTSSKAVQSSPFLAPPPPARLHDFATDFGDAYKELVNVCAHFYQGTHSRPSQSLGSISDTSSDSGSSLSDDIESVDGRPSPLLAINARLDDAIETDTNAKETTAHPPACHLVSCPPSLTIEEALEPRSLPRLVTNSAPPYKIVHANAAYARISGLPSSSILGQPLFKLLASVASEKLSLASCAAASGDGRDLVVSIVSQSDKESTDTAGIEKSIKCSMKVSPIVSGAQPKHNDAARGNESQDAHHEVNNVTHFAVDMSEHDNTNQNAHENHHVNLLNYEPVQVHTTVVG